MLPALLEHEQVVVLRDDLGRVDPEPLVVEEVPAVVLSKQHTPLVLAHEVAGNRDVRVGVEAPVVDPVDQELRRPIHHAAREGLDDDDTPLGQAEDPFEPVLRVIAVVQNGERHDGVVARLGARRDLHEGKLPNTRVTGAVVVDVVERDVRVRVGEMHRHEPIAIIVSGNSTSLRSILEHMSR